jgi:hypothetical protein
VEVRVLRGASQKAPLRRGFRVLRARFPARGEKAPEALTQEPEIERGDVVAGKLDPAALQSDTAS